jgi:receptor-type tyrosine-protein phosphatase N
MNNVPSPIDSKLNDALNEDYSETLDDLNETEMSSHQIGKELDEIENNLDQIQSELIKNENVQQQADYDDDDDDGGEDDDDVAANDYDDIGSNEILSKPLVHESQGVDKYGNQFHEKDISYSGHSDSHPDNRFESFYKTLNVVNDNASPEQMQQQQQHENEPTIDDYFVHEPESIHDLESNGGVNIIDEIDHVLSGNPAEALLNAYMNNPAESEMPPRTYPSFEQKHEDVRSPEENNGQNDYLNDIFGVEPLVKVEYLSSPKEMPSTVDMSSPLTRMKIGLHYNMQMPPQSPPASETFESLRSDMNNANKLMQEINSILDASSNSANPVEDVINAFMTHHGELDRKQASAPLPSFKQKLQENVDLAKKSMLDLHINPRIVNPNIFAEEEIVDTEQKHHSTKHFNTYDYFEPVFVDSKANDDEKKANIKDLESNLNKEQDEFIKSLTPKTDQLDQVYEVASDANMENDSKHSALNALLKNTQGKYDYVDSSYIFIELDKTIKDYEAVTLLGLVAAFASIPIVAFQDISVQNNLILFKINDPIVNSTFAIEKILEHQLELKEKGYNVISCGLGRDDHRIKIKKQSDYIAIVTIILCASIASTLLIIFAIFLIRRRVLLRSKLVDALGNTSIHKPSGGGGKFDDEERLVQRSSSGRQNTKPWYSFIRREQVNETTPKKDYQDLCRARMHGNKSPQQQPSCETPNMVTPGLNASQKTTNCTINSTPIRTNEEANESNRSSTSSCLIVTSKFKSEEPISSVNMDITTGHVILSYMEEHLNDKNRLGKEWKELENYEADQKSTYIGSLPAYMIKNRYSNIIAYDHNRVKIGQNTESDYINANFIMDDDPKNPVYIATQGPLMTTTNDFWQMVWEQGSVVIVSLCRTVESGTVKCNQYWPVNGSEVHDKFEVNLVSEHVWCEDYLVRNFFLKNCETNQTRTVTQFHFLTWPENGVPQSIKSVLDFRRKVNKSYKSKSCPIIVHCSDGIGRAGTYIMIDMVLNKIARGAKEIDLAATLEYLRDQRPGMIKTKNQFEFSFAVVTEEVQNMLKALNP